MQTMFNIEVAVAAAGVTSVYFQNPYDAPCTLRNVRGCANAQFNGEETVTIVENSGTTTLGVFTLADSAAGTVGSWVSDTTNGDHVIGADEVLKLTPTEVGDTAGVIRLTLELDPHCLTGLV